ncbi:MAG: di-heme-cytochrome C peroxidase [Nitrosomonas sp.]|nr:di-heme-cytochrome C peroxidase [Nitrosomonas sp.]
MKNAKLIIIFFVVLVIGFCSTNIYSSNQVVPVVKTDGVVPERIELNQGWSPEIRDKFWFTSQGSRILPYVWFMWLEQADSNKLFRNVEHMDSLRYLPMKSSQRNPAGLPIGFALDNDKKSGDAWLGLTCAACHTNQVDYQGTRMLIEGAPTLANFVKFFSELINSLDKTSQDDAKFARFAEKVLGDKHSPSSAKDLREQLSTVTFNLAQRQAVNALPADYPDDFTSYARLDAFGNIQNAASAFALHDIANKNYPTAPVSYPFLWGTHQSDVVQWNGSAPNTPIIGPLVRNMGEVVGVFGSLSMDERPWWSPKRWFGDKIKYSSTVNMHNLGKLELWVKQLRSPNWSDTNLPSIDMAKAAKGSVIYREQCASCHQVIPSDKQKEKYKAVMTPINEVGTDPTMAKNAGELAKTLALEGTKVGVLFGEDFSDTAPAVRLAINGVIGLVLKDPVKALEAGLIPEKGHKIKPFDIKSGVKENLMERQSAQQTDDDVLAYKARPLNGIWATAPYLHNGSVPSLWELLKSPKERATTFWVGSREFDPVNVGFITDKGLSNFSVNKAATNTIQPGNSNRGHAYGTNLTDEQKWSVIEYMKTL